MKALDKLLGGQQNLIGIALLALLILVVFPLTLDAFRLNMVGKYLTYAFVAVGLVLCWGYGGILSLGQGVFFGVGGYCMAMFLKLEASDPESTKIQSTPGIPDFMDWNQITELPWLWQPFHSFSFTLVAVIAVPVLLAFIIGMALFKRRVGDVYFSIVTQAIALILTVLIVGQQGLTGGVNGITDLKTLLGWDLRTDSAKLILYFINAGLLFGCIFIGRFILASKLGRLLMAMRDKEERVRFSGYDVASFKIFVFCVAAAFSAIWRGHVRVAGGLYVAVVRGHRAVDRDGDLCRRGRAHVAARRGVRRAAGELWQDLLFRVLSRAVAVPDGRAVHRRGHVLPQWPGRLVGQPWSAGIGPAAAPSTTGASRGAGGQAQD